TWLPNESILVLQRFAVPLDVMLASILGQYSRYLHRVGKVERGRSPYMSRYQSIEVTSGVLPYAVRHLYWQGFKAGLCASALEYPFCSYRLHYAPEVPPWFERSDFVAALEQRGYVGRSGAERFLSKPESPRHVALFESRSGRKPQIVGETADVEEARWRAKYAPRAPSLSQVINAVAAMLHRDANELGESVLGKSLTTWYATRGGIATLEEMGRWFDCAPTTLRRDIESHRRTSPTLFEFSLEELLALARDVMSESITTGAPVQESISNAGPGSAASDEHHVADEAHPPLGWH
ncbi:MAG TPA: hypothetical protein VI653_08840, partial [Steroidobacteraceae bacterium]